MKCCSCGEEAGEWGNNARPVKEGQCCNICNKTKVIPERMKRMGLLE